MSAQTVDVLAVMDSDALCAKQYRMAEVSIDAALELATKSDAARTAVTELIRCASLVSDKGTASYAAVVALREAVASVRGGQ